MRKRCLPWRLALGLLLAGAGTPASGSEPLERVRDGSFDDPTLAAWNLEIYDTSTIEWVDVDASGLPASGSVRLWKKVGENPNSVRLNQCLSLGAGPIEVSGRAFAPAPAPAHAPYLVLAFFPEPGCTGGGIGYAFPSNPVLAPGVWTQIGPLQTESPEGTRSARVYVGIVATIEPGSADVYELGWDDVSVLPEPGRGATAAAGLALAALGRRRRRASG